MNKYYLGIDTSAYTTSIGIVNEEGQVILDLRKRLKVAKNKRGLRQQEAVFQHIKNLPEMFAKVSETIDINDLMVVSASTKPRNIEKSYMPVFVVGKEQAFIISKLLNIPYKEFSHQEGHISAGIIGTALEREENFLAFHISGGTTELLFVNNKREKFDIERIGGTLDISIGQLVDRIGVKRGLDFPCGEKMDYLSQNGSIINKKIPISVKDTWANFSGYENLFNDLIDNKKYLTEDIIKTLFYTIYLCLEEIIVNSCMNFNIGKVLLIGGVASNIFIRKNLSESLSKRGIDLYIPPIEYCSDNGIGTAYLGNVKNDHR